MKSYLIYLIIFVLVFCSKTRTSDLPDKIILFSLLNLKNHNEEYNWNLPKGFPIPIVPETNPMTRSKVELGRFLFYENKLSGNKTQSCASCHIQAIAFSDGSTVGIGSTGEIHPRNSQALANTAYFSRLTWMNSNIKSLEQQSRLPLFGTTPVEMGLSEIEFLYRIENDPIYINLFNKAFKNDPRPFSEQNIRFALSSFIRSMISGNSNFDKYYFENKRNSLSESQINGMRIFNSREAKCSVCHTGFNFSDSVTSESGILKSGIYHDNGHKSTQEYNVLPINERGFFELTENSSDIGKFRTPTLRNIAFTYPYMHDGSFHCDLNLQPNPGVYSEECARNALTKVIEHYMSGGKTPSNKNSNLIRSFSLTPSEKEDLLNFLFSLSDNEFVKNPQYANPF